MPSNRKLVPLADYDAALNGVSFVGTILGLLLIAAGALPHVARNVPPGPDRWWMALLIQPLVMAVGSPMVLWLVGSSRRNMRQTPLLVCPACQQVPWSSHAVRLTGCCDRCSEPMVELPSASGPMLKSTSELSENRRAMMRGLLGFVFVALCVFSLAIVVAWFTENLAHLAMGGAAFFVVFFSGLVLVDRRSNRQTFECPNCKVDLRKNPKAVPWNNTTGRCVKCARIALAVKEPAEAENKLSLAKLRKHQDFRGEWGVGLLLLFMISAPAFPVILMRALRFADIPGWVMWCGLPLFIAVVWQVAPNRCPLCRKSTFGSESIVIATRKCPHCLGLIVDGVSAPSDSLSFS